jgi:thioredoxin 2
MDANAQLIECANCGATNRVQTGTGKAPVCGRCKNPLAVQTKPVHITDANFAAEVEQSNLPVLIDFWAAWCGPCRMVAPVIDALAKDLAGKVKIGKLDVDKNPVTASRFRVQSIPTLLIVQNGREADRIVGAQSKEAILSRLRNFL